MLSPRRPPAAARTCAYTQLTTHLQAMEKTPQARRKRFDFCDDITSGLMEGVCTARDNRVDEQARKRRLAQLSASFDNAQRQTFATPQQAALNAAYVQALKAAGAREPQDPPGQPGSIDADGIRHAERAWLQYRDAWVAFCRTRYPGVGGDAWRTYFTRQRTAMRKEVSGNGG
jgi:uncharacterized protein YecT (DUF1311 family)